MDIYQSVPDYIANLPVITEWAEAKSVLAHAASLRPRDWRLPLLACEAVGGTAEQAIPAIAALACAQIGIILIDDMLDNDPRGEYRRVGEGQAANYAAVFLSAGTQAILQDAGEPARKLAAVHSLSQMIVTTALGQYLDSQNPSDEAGYWSVAESKSAPFFGTALYLGAVFGEASERITASLERFGQLYGEMIQIHDDLNDTMSTPANPDWLQNRSPLPILFAQSVDHPDRGRFLELRGDVDVSDTQALREAQDILIRCGAVSYCVDQLLRRHQAARQVLADTLLAKPEAMDRLLEEIVAPVQRLLESMGESRLP